MNPAELKAIFDNPAASAEDRAAAQRLLTTLDANEMLGGDYSEQNIFRLLADDGVIGADDEHLRAVYLADPSTSIWWARLAFWRDRLKSGSQTLRSFSKDRIQKFTDDTNIPDDVRKAAGDLLSAFSQRKLGDPVPAIQIPGSERWKTMPGDELYLKHMAPIKKRVIETFYSPR